MYINSVTKIADGSCAADYLLPNQAITDLMKQFLRSMDTKRGAEFHPKYSRYEEEASTRHEKDVLSQKEKIVNEKNAEAKKIGMKNENKQVDLAILSVESNKSKVVPRKRKIEEPDAFLLTDELKAQIDLVAKREVDKLVKQNYVAVPKNISKKRKISK